MSSDEDIELERGSRNVFRDFDRAAADIEHAKATLAARIIGVLDDAKLSVRQAAKTTGFAAADFSRIRNADLGRFTIDRMIRMLGALDQDTQVTIAMHTRARGEAAEPGQPVRG